MIKKIACLVLCLLLIGCTNQEKKEVEKEPNTVVSQTKELNTWCVYWDIKEDTQQEIRTMTPKIDTLCYFGAYFQDGILAVPDNMMQYYQQNKNASYQQYVTVINDVVNKDATSLKDENIVIEKLTSEQAMNAHIKELVELVKTNNFDGLELDYEDFNTNLTLWNQYVVFIDKLYQALQKEDKGLRVLLEAKSPIDKVQLPNGPTYVMMCYNLYGGFSEPGPKANQEFLNKVKDKAKNVSNMEYALATGGFEWGGPKVTNVTVEQALLIAEENNVQPTKDKSGAWYFTYQKDQVEYTIWYSDKETIDIWKEALGVSTISIWKMGGNHFSE